MTSAALRAVTLLDEELALLAPGCGPLPHLDGLDDASHDLALQTTARSLLVRGLGVAEGRGLLPAPELAPLLAPLTARSTAVHLVAALRETQDAVFTVFHDVAGGPDVLVHDTTEDGVHLLTLLPRDEARAQLAGALDPLGRTGEPATPGAAGDLQEPEAVARLTVVVPGGEPVQVGTVTAPSGCWCLRSDRPDEARPLDRAGLAGLVDELLPG